MLLYYRFFHPAGPIKPFIGESVDFQLDPECKLSPDFVIHDARFESASFFPETRSLCFVPVFYFEW
jgi:hypothetical protein